MSLNSALSIERSSDLSQISIVLKEKDFSAPFLSRLFSTSGVNLKKRCTTKFVRFRKPEHCDSLQLLE